MLGIDDGALELEGWNDGETEGARLGDDVGVADGELEGSIVGASKT